MVDEETGNEIIENENIENQGAEETTTENVEETTTETEDVGKVTTEDARTEKEGNFFTKQSTPVKIIIAIVAICCIGAIIFVIAGLLTPGGINFDASTGFHMETVGAHSFKIPASFEKVNETTELGGAKMAFFQSRSNSNKRFAITAFTNELDLDEFAVEFGEQIGVDGEETTINGEPAYKFENTKNGVYSFILNIDGKSYSFSVSDAISNPDQFVADLI